MTFCDHPVSDGPRVSFGFNLQLPATKTEKSMGNPQYRGALAWNDVTVSKCTKHPNIQTVQVYSEELYAEFNFLSGSTLILFIKVVFVRRCVLYHDLCILSSLLIA